MTRKIKLNGEINKVTHKQDEEKQEMDVASETHSKNSLTPGNA